MSFVVKVDKLTVNNANSSNQSYVHISSVNEDDETGLGQLFIIAEIRSKEKKVPEMLNQSIKELSEYYYHSPTKNTEAALETTCQYFNENITDITSKPLKWVKDKTSILIATIQDDKLVLASYGHLKVWLLRENKIHEIISGKQKPLKSNSKKFLSQLISGQLIEDDVVLLTNSTIFDYFSDEKIKKTVSTLAPTQACAFFKNALLDFDTTADFSTIIVKLQPLKKGAEDIQDLSHPNILTHPEDENIAEINQAEPGLVSKVGKHFVNGIKNAAKKSIKHAKKIQSKSPKLNTPGEKQPIPGTELPSNEITEETKDTVDIIAKDEKKTFFPQYKLVIVVVIILILFIGSLIFVSRKNEKNEMQENFTTTVEQIREKISSSEAALIYKDEEKAQTLLQEARTLLGTLETNNSEEDYTYQQLNKEIEQQVYKIFKLVELDLSVKIAAFPDGFTPTSNIFMSSKDILYLANRGKVYKVNSKNKNLDEVADLDDIIIKKFIALDNNYSVLYAGGNKAYVMDMRNNSTRAVSFNLKNDNSNYTDVALYAQKAYILDTGNNNIYKLNYSSGLFGNPSAWLQDEEIISDNISIAIDGNIYLASADGKISKYFKGVKEIFNIKGTFEPISNETIIFTEDTLNKIYLIDKAKDRIIITDKQGRVQNQIMSAKNNTIYSLTPAADEKNIYVMTNSGIYTVNIE